MKILLCPDTGLTNTLSDAEAEKRQSSKLDSLDDFDRDSLCRNVINRLIRHRFSRII